MEVKATRNNQGKRDGRFVIVNGDKVVAGPFRSEDRARTLMAAMESNRIQIVAVR